MKLICLKSHLPVSWKNELHPLNLTVGKIYDVVEHYPKESYWWVLNDNNKISNYTKDKGIFMSLAEWRDQQIDAILND